MLDELEATPTNNNPYFDNSFFDELIGVSQLAQFDDLHEDIAAVIGLMALGVDHQATLVDALHANRRDLAVLRALASVRGDTGRSRTNAVDGLPGRHTRHRSALRGGQGTQRGNCPRSS